MGNLEYACGASLDKVSAKHYDQNEAFPQLIGHHCVLDEGYGRVLEELATGLDIRLGINVKKICEMYNKFSILVPSTGYDLFSLNCHSLAFEEGNTLIASGSFCRGRRGRRLIC